MVLRVSYNLLIIGSSCLLNTKKINIFFKEEEKGFIEDHKLNYSKMHFGRHGRDPTLLLVLLDINYSSHSLK